VSIIKLDDYFQVAFDQKFKPKALFTPDILAHNIAIKRYCDKKTFLSKYFSHISKSYQIDIINIFNSHGENYIYWLKNIFLSQYLFITILCAKMTGVNRA